MVKQLPPTFAEFVVFIRKFTGERSATINSDTLLENDLGVTGDDGIELLEAVEREYGISLEPVGQVFQLKPGEYLFEGEGFMISILQLSVLCRWLGLSKGPKPSIRAFRAGELYEVICRLIKAKSP